METSSALVMGELHRNDPLVFEGMRVLEERRFKGLESEINRLKGINQQLWKLLTDQFFEYVQKWVNKQLGQDSDGSEA